MQASAQREIEETAATWSAFFANTRWNWEPLVRNVEPKETGCGLVYEIEGPIDRPGESVAIADMRSIDVAEPHYHADPETEIYLVLQGTGTVVVGSDVHGVGPGDVVITPPGVAHYTIPHDQLVLAVVNTPPFDPTRSVSVSKSDATVKFDAHQFERFFTTPTLDMRLSETMRTLAEDLDVWSTVLLVPNQARTALASRARHGLPDDWAACPNLLGSGSMNARAFHEQISIIENGIDQDLPPTDRPVSRHRITAAAVVPVSGVGTLEAIADTDGYTFDESSLARLQSGAEEITDLLSR